MICGFGAIIRRVAQQFQVGLHGAVKALTQDSELLKSAKVTYSKEVKTLKAEIAKLSASSAEGWEKAKKLIWELKSAREDALTESTPVDDQGVEDVTLNASTDTAGGEIPMDSAYLNSSANLNSVAGMDHDPVPTLTEEGQGDTVATKEEDPSAALQLNRQRSRHLLDQRRWIRTEFLNRRLKMLWPLLLSAFLFAL
nr:uncharacterized protein LOC109180246 [Ipomoea batatas]